MAEFNIRDVTGESVDDLCRMCIPPEKMDAPIFIKGREEKKKWAIRSTDRYSFTSLFSEIMSRYSLARPSLRPV